MLGLVVASRATTTALHHSPLNYCVSVVKEEAFAAKVVFEYEMYSTKPQTQNRIFETRIYSFLFQPSVRTAQKRQKALKIKPFALFRANS